MIKITIKKKNKLKTFECQFADKTFSGQFYCHVLTDSKLSEIAKEFDDPDEITVHETLADKTFTEFTKVVSVVAKEDGYMVALK